MVLTGESLNGFKENFQTDLAEKQDLMEHRH
jgi:hypothetical protein